jgi:putative transposase
MQASREYGIKDTVISRWKQEFLERAPEMFKQNNWQNDQEIQQRVVELERLVGRLTLELDMAKKVFGYSDSVKRGSE